MARSKRSSIYGEGLGLFAAGLAGVAFTLWHPGATGRQFGQVIQIAGGGVILMCLGVSRLFRARSTQLLGLSHAALSQGRTGGVLEIIGSIEALPDRWFTRRFTESQRADYWFLVGDLDRAAAHCRASRAVPLGLRDRTQKRQSALFESSMLALILALRGDATALDEIRAVEQSAFFSAGLRVKTTLARALLLDQQGKRNELRSLLRTEATHLLTYSALWDRAILRALREKLRGKSQGGYRQAPRGPLDEAKSSEGERWLQLVAPHLLGAESTPEGLLVTTAGLAPDASPEQAQKLDRPPGGSAPRLPTHSAWTEIRSVAALLWLPALVAIVNLGILRYQGYSHSSTPWVDGYPSLRTGPVMAACWFVAMLVVLRSACRQMKRLWQIKVEIHHLLALGDPAGVIALLMRENPGRMLSFTDSTDLYGSQALEQLGWPVEALARCDEGIHCMKKRWLNGIFNSITLHGLLAQRATLLAMLDRESETKATITQIEQLKHGAPEGWPLEPTRFRVALITKLRQGQIAETAALVARRPANLGLDLREEFVCEVLDLVSRGGTEAARESLREELAEIPWVEAWLERYVPAVLRALGRGDQGSWAA